MKIGDKVKIVRRPGDKSTQSSSIVGKIGTIEKIHVFASASRSERQVAQWHEIIVDGSHITICEDELECINYTNMYDELEVTLNG